MPHAHGHENLDKFIAGDLGAARLLGQHARLHRQPAEGMVGRGGDRRERLLLRLPAAPDRQPQHLRHGDGADQGHRQGLLPVRREPRRRLGQHAHAAPRHVEARLARRARLLADRVRDVVEGRAGDRVRRDAHRGDRHRGVLLPRRRAHREGRHVHQHPADAAVAPQGAGARRTSSAATCGSSTTSASACASASPARATSATARCSS